MIETILLGLHQWFHSTSHQFTLPPSSPTDTILEQVQTAFLSQTAIGWHNFLKGRLSCDWFLAHDTYCSLRQLPTSSQSTTIGPKLINIILTASLNVWKSRNTFFHGATKAENQQIRSASADSDITDHYRSKDRFTPEDQALLFQAPLSEILQESLHYKSTWLMLASDCLSPPPPAEDSASSTSALHPFFHQFASQYES